MLKKLYVNNYKCLSNFEIHLGDISLLMGSNGGGKSTIFDVLYNIRNFVVNNVEVSNIFPTDSVTIWMQQKKQTNQTFEMTVQGPEGTYTYQLVIAHAPDLRKQRVAKEQLLLDGQPLLQFDQGEVTFYHNDFSKGPTYSFNWSLSAFTIIQNRQDNTKLMWFKEWLSRLIIVSLQPRNMESETLEESEWLNKDGTNFASWYRYFSQEHQDKLFILTQKLRDILPGFLALKLAQDGKRRILQAGFSDIKENITQYYEFDQLSDGQRVLIILYSLLSGIQNSNYTLLLDEPENYLALAEIQPWLMELNDVCQQDLLQTILISHHPELIDYFGAETGIWIEREPNEPSRITRVVDMPKSSIKLSDQIARGWLDD